MNLAGSRRISEDLSESRRISENLGESRRISQDLAESRRISQDLAGSRRSPSCVRWFSRSVSASATCLYAWWSRRRAISGNLGQSRRAALLSRKMTISGNLRQSRAVSSCRLVEQEDDRRVQHGGQHARPRLGTEGSPEITRDGPRWPEIGPRLPEMRMPRPRLGIEDGAGCGEGGEGLEGKTAAVVGTRAGGGSRESRRGGGTRGSASSRGDHNLPPPPSGAISGDLASW